MLQYAVFSKSSTAHGLNANDDHDHFNEEAYYY